MKRIWIHIGVLTVVVLFSIVALFLVRSIPAGLKMQFGDGGILGRGWWKSKGTIQHIPEVPVEKE